MWIKICGITRPSDGAASILAGADAIGLNFFPLSQRFVDTETAKQIVAAIRGTSFGTAGQLPDIVGVFVNAETADIVEAAEVAELTALQFHGDESPEQIRQAHLACPKLAVIRACRVDAQNLQNTISELARLQDTVPIAACLLDTFVKGHYGGTGHSLSSVTLQQLKRSKIEVPVILAGGLTSKNVAEVLQHYLPWGIDTASGVESLPGIKDAAEIKVFVMNARTASPSQTVRRLMS